MGKLELAALKGIDMEIRRGEYISIMGPSGSGKSTLFNMIGALDKPTEGKVYIDEVDVAQLEDRIDAVARDTGRGFDDADLAPRQPIEYRTLADIRTTHDGDDGKRHRRIHELRKRKRPTDQSQGRKPVDPATGTRDARLRDVTGLAPGARIAGRAVAPNPFRSTLQRFLHAGQ